MVVLRRVSNQPCTREKVCWLIPPLSPSRRDVSFLPFCRCGDGRDTWVQAVSCIVVYSHSLRGQSALHAMETERKKKRSVERGAGARK